MSRYYLFRNDLLIGKKDDDTPGTGDLYALGQEGDTLVQLGEQHVNAFNWRLQTSKDSTAWSIHKLTVEEQQRYRLLVSLQA